MQTNAMAQGVQAPDAEPNSASPEAAPALVKTERKRSWSVGVTREIQQNLKLDISNLLFFGQASLEYEHLLGQSTSLALALKYGHVTDGWWDSQITGHTNLGCEALFRFYLLERFYAPRGLWVGPAVGYMSETYDTRGGTTWGFANLSAKAGWQFVFGKPDRGFVVSPYLGVGYTWGSGDSVAGYGRSELKPYTGIYPQLGVAFGAAF